MNKCNEREPTSVFFIVVVLSLVGGVFVVLARARGPAARRLFHFVGEGRARTPRRHNDTHERTERLVFRARANQHTLSHALSRSHRSTRVRRRTRGDDEDWLFGLYIIVPMAKNLINAGHEVTVWNRTSDAAKPVVDAGAALAATAAEACAASDVTFVMVSTPEAATAVANAAKDGLSAGKGYVDVSTVDAETSSAIAEIVRSTGAEFLEAPVSGSKKPAEDGALIFLCAGDETLYRRCSEPLETMGKAHFFLGDVGQGAKMKLVVNMIMGSMMTAFAEGLTLSEKCDLDPETLLQVISLGAIASPMFALKGRR